MKMPINTLQQDLNRRFLGVTKLYGEQGLQRFQAGRAIVLGVGGVGAWTVEALARSGVGSLTLVDLDHFAESNINRQLPALDSTLGKAKVLVLRTRIGEINAACKVVCIEDFISADNIDGLLAAHSVQPGTIVIDCIDHANTKAAVIAWCRRHKTKLITVGGAGGRVDPLRIRIGDLSRTQNDSLLARTRKHLRQDYAFPRNPKRSFCVPAVYSIEAPRPFQGGDGAVAPGGANGLNCAGLGSVAHVTASFGMAAAGKALDILAQSPSAG